MGPTIIAIQSEFGLSTDPAMPCGMKKNGLAFIDIASAHGLVAHPIQSAYCRGPRHGDLFG